jgi:SAM-dependent methyltransferase
MVSHLHHWNSALYQDNYSFVWQYGQAVLKLLAPQAGESILDIGCGTGQLTADIAKTGAEVVGVDYSPDMIATARKNYPELRFEVAEASQLPFVNEFDAVFSNAVLHWVRDQIGVVNSVARALKPDGRFVFEMGGHRNIQQIWRAMAEALRALKVEQPERLCPWHYATVGEYATLLESQNLEVRFATLFDRPPARRRGARIGYMAGDVRQVRNGCFAA